MNHRHTQATAPPNESIITAPNRHVELQQLSIDQNSWQRGVHFPSLPRRTWIHLAHPFQASSLEARTSASEDRPSNRGGFANCSEGAIRSDQSTAFPKTTEQPLDADRHQDRPQRPIADELLAGARHTVNFVSSLLIVFRGYFANLLKLVLGNVLCSPPLCQHD